MTNSLVRLLRGDPDPKPPSQSPEAQEIHREVQLAALRADGAIRMAEHVMDGLVDLDLHRRELAQGDPTLNILLAEIESEAAGQVKKQQRNLYGKWDLT